jgi:hypothetical protein
MKRKRDRRDIIDRENMRDPLGEMISAIDKIEGDAIAYVNKRRRKKGIPMEKISSAEMIERAGGVTEDQKRGAQEMIDRIKAKYADFKIALDDVLAVHVAQGLPFEHIEKTLTGMIEEDKE